MGINSLLGLFLAGLFVYLTMRSRTSTDGRHVNSVIYHLESIVKGPESLPLTIPGRGGD